MKIFGRFLSLTFEFKVLIGLIVTYFVIMTTFSLATYSGNKMRMNDMGNMTQAIYNTTTGRVMEFSNAYIYDDPVSNRLGGHANLIFFLFVPIYWLVSDSRILLIIQIAVAASSLVPLYFLSTIYFGKKSWWNLLGPILYVINPVIQDVLLFDFHALTLAMPLLIWSIYYLLTSNYKKFYVMSVLVALCKEDMPLVVAMMGLYMWWKMGEKKKGIMVIALALVYFILMVWIVMPQFRGEQSSLMETRYGYLTGGTGVDFGQIVSSLIVPEKIWYLPKILVSVGGLALLAPQILIIGIPSLAVNLLSSNKIMYQLYGFYYPATIMAVVLVASVVGFGSLKSSKKKHWQQTGAGALAFSILVSFMYSPLPYSRASSFEEFDVSDHAKKMEEVVKLIPENASVSVQNNLGYKLANRRSIITFPYKSDSADYVVIDVSDPYAVVRVEPRQRNFVFVTNLSLADYRDSVQYIFDNDNYGIFYAEDGYLVFAKNEPKTKNEDAYKMFEQRMKHLEEKYAKFVTGYGGEE